jgi:hypothetical protein
LCSLDRKPQEIAEADSTSGHGHDDAQA